MAHLRQSMRLKQIRHTAAFRWRVRKGRSRARIRRWAKRWLSRAGRRFDQEWIEEGLEEAA